MQPQSADRLQPADDAVIDLAKDGDAVLLQPDIAGRRLVDGVGGGAGMAECAGGEAGAATVERALHVGMHVEHARDIVKVAAAIIGNTQFLTEGTQVQLAMVLAPVRIDGRRTDEQGNSRFKFSVAAHSSLPRTPQDLEPLPQLSVAMLRATPRTSL